MPNRPGQSDNVNDRNVRRPGNDNTTARPMSASTGNQGGGGSHNNELRFFEVTYLIKIF